MGRQRLALPADVRHRGHLPRAGFGDRPGCAKSLASSLARSLAAWAFDVTLLTMPTQNHTTGPGGLQRGLGAFADQAPFFLGQGGVNVQHEWIGVGAQLGGRQRSALEGTNRQCGQNAPAVQYVSQILASTSRTDAANHLPPRAVGIPGH